MAGSTTMLTRHALISKLMRVVMNFDSNFDWTNHRTPSRRMRRCVIGRDGNICRYCCKMIDEAHLTVDHVIPFSRGGRTVIDNLVVACKRCNQKKGNYLPHEVNMLLMPQLREF
jgi:5-methylcytosine-specific restriction endonuclease McrA